MTTPGATCPSGKIGYASSQRAWRHLRIIQREGSRRPERSSKTWFHAKAHWNVYRCNRCTEWHIGRSPEAKRPKPRSESGFALVRDLLGIVALVAGAVSLELSVQGGLELEGQGRTCIAWAVFTEARGEPIQGQIAVAEVIRARLEDEPFADPCELVQRTSQFTGTLDRRPPWLVDKNAWETALAVTDGVMDGTLAACGVEAEHFYPTDRPAPTWAENMRPVCEVAGHRFLAEVAP